MALNRSTLAKWHAQPNLARSWAQFLESKDGELLMGALEHEFGPTVDTTPVVAGVDYTQVYAFRGAAYEACAKVFKIMRDMAIPRAPKPEPKESTPGFHSTLQREPEKEPPAAPSPPVRKSPRKKR